MFGTKRQFRFKGDGNQNENRLFWILVIIVSLIFILIAEYG
ncbi:hypothetical protein [Pelobium manganitolerans]|nr:hypothetical protein [Pelobium manganitolerans]